MDEDINCGVGALTPASLDLDETIEIILKWEKVKFGFSRQNNCFLCHKYS